DTHSFARERFRRRATDTGRTSSDQRSLSIQFLHSILQYVSSLIAFAGKPLRRRMLLLCSIISGCPHRYVSVSSPVSPHSSTYFLNKSSTRPRSPFQVTSSDDRLIVGTYVSQCAVDAMLASSSW